MRYDDGAPRRVLLEVIPRHSILAGADDGADLAGDSLAAAQLHAAGIEVDTEWPALSLGGSYTGTLGGLIRRPGFAALVEQVNRIGGAVVDALTLDIRGANDHHADASERRVPRSGRSRRSR